MVQSIGVPKARSMFPTMSQVPQALSCIIVEVMALPIGLVFRVSFNILKHTILMLLSFSAMDLEQPA
jgi:hypothetical protein